MELLIDEPQAAGGPVLMLAHGAGGGMRTAFLTALARDLAAEGVRVARFEFPYMSAGRRAPDRQPALLDSWREAIATLGVPPQALFIGGKSLGGRMASMIAGESGVRGLVCLGYPFHPPGRGDALRTAHLMNLRTPALIVQGERDPFGTREEVASYGLPSAIEMVWLPDGDHSFKPRRQSGATDESNRRLAVSAIRRFLFNGHVGAL